MGGTLLWATYGLAIRAYPVVVANLLVFVAAWATGRSGAPAVVVDGNRPRPKTVEDDHFDSSSPCPCNGSRSVASKSTSTLPEQYVSFKRRSIKAAGPSTLRGLSRLMFAMTRGAHCPLAPPA
jgi:hypothetical protein